MTDTQSKEELELRRAVRAHPALKAYPGTQNYHVLYECAIEVGAAALESARLALQSSEARHKEVCAQLIFGGKADRSRADQAEAKLAEANKEIESCQNGEAILKMTIDDLRSQLSSSEERSQNTAIDLGNEIANLTDKCADLERTRKAENENADTIIAKLREQIKRERVVKMVDYNSDAYWTAILGEKMAEKEKEIAGLKGMDEGKLWRAFIAGLHYGDNWNDGIREYPTSREAFGAFLASRKEK